jgi:hypothetical protein
VSYLPEIKKDLFAYLETDLRKYKNLHLDLYHLLRYSLLHCQRFLLYPGDAATSFCGLFFLTYVNPEFTFMGKNELKAV